MRTTSVGETHPSGNLLLNLDLKVHSCDLILFTYLLMGGGGGVNSWICLCVENLDECCNILEPDFCFFLL